MACQDHAVACIPCQAHVLERHYSQTNYHKSFQAPIGWFIKRLLGALSRPCRGMSSPCRGMPCQAHAVACQALVVACLVPMFWHVKPYRGIPCQAHVVGCHVEGMSSPCQGMPCQAHVVACQALVVACLVPMFWHVKPYRGMPCQAHVVGCLVKPVSRHVENVSRHALSSPRFREAL
jgi:hypothetical protein